MQDPVLPGDAKQGVQMQLDGILPPQCLLLQWVLGFVTAWAWAQCFMLLKVLGNGQPVLQCRALVRLGPQLAPQAAQ